ncbi:PLCXD2 family protein [Megaselia abdita]
MVSVISDLPRWMEKLPAFVRQEVPIIYLAIPGSHSSMTYAINKKSRLAKDAKRTYKMFRTFFPYAVRKWSKSQNFDVRKQLRNGVRYFDLRISFNESTKEYFFFYGLFALEINSPLLTISDYLTSHPHEVVILDFQDFYRFSIRDHEILQKTILAIFDQKLITREDGILNDITLDITLKKKQAFVIYRRSPIPLTNDFWTHDNWSNPPAKPHKTKHLKRFLTEELRKRNPSAGYITKCILNPEKKYICVRLFSSLKSAAQKVARDLKPWITSQKVGLFRSGEPPSANVFIADFIDLDDSQFCKWVIDLNSKLESGTCYCGI